MRLFTYVRHRQWVPVAGYVFYVAALTAGYYYNLTFVQLGLVDLGTRLVGMSRQDVSTVMAVLALVALVVALVSGVVLDRRGWGTDLHVKIRLLHVVVTAQLLLTVVAPTVRTPGGFVAWVLACSLPLGVGIPVMFSTMLDFIPVRDRGYVAACVAGLAFFVAALYPFEWRIEEFGVVQTVRLRRPARRPTRRVRHRPLLRLRADAHPEFAVLGARAVDVRGLFHR